MYRGMQTIQSHHTISTDEPNNQIAHEIDQQTHIETWVTNHTNTIATRHFDAAILGINDSPQPDEDVETLRSIIAEYKTDDQAFFKYTDHGHGTISYIIFTPIGVVTNDDEIESYIINLQHLPNADHNFFGNEEIVLLDPYYDDHEYLKHDFATPTVDNIKDGDIEYTFTIHREEYLTPARKLADRIGDNLSIKDNTTQTDPN